MPTSFMHLSGELRNRIYELVLVKDRPIRLSQNYDYGEELDTELLRANKAIQREASSIFYGQNQFDFTRDASNDLERTIYAPLRQIGSNSALIQSILLDIPIPKDPAEPDYMSIPKWCRKIRNQLRNLCPNVRKIMIPIDSMDPFEGRMCMGDAPINYSQVICMINEFFGAFEFSPQITVNVFKHFPDGEDFYGNSCELTYDMKSRGWKLQIIDQATLKLLVDEEHV